MTVVHFSTGELAERLGAVLEGDPDIPIRGIAEPAQAGPDHVAPILTRQYLGDGADSAAGAFVLPRAWGCQSLLRGVQLLCADARAAMGQLLRLFEGRPAAVAGVHPRALVEPSASVDPTAWVGPFCYVAEGVRIGPEARIEAFTYVGPQAQISARCRVGPHAVVSAKCRVLEGAMVGPGAVVGHDGFGFWRDGDSWQLMPSLGDVEVGPDASLGANSCVDRATLGTTRVGRGAQVDNLVQVGHNTRIGRSSLLCAQVGLAGGVRVGDDAVLGGQVGVADHLEVGAGARVGAGSGVVRDVDDADTVSGYPAFGHSRWLRASVLFTRLGAMAQQLRRMERRIESLETDHPESE